MNDSAHSNATVHALPTREDTLAWSREGEPAPSVLAWTPAAGPSDGAPLGCYWDAASHSWVAWVTL